MTEKSRQRTVVWSVSAALVVAVLLLYGQTIRFGFVNLDDYVYVLENPMVTRGMTTEGLRWAFSTYHTGNWHPLTWVSLMADSSIFGPGPAGHHVTNTLLHAANAALLFLALLRMTGALWPSALAAALFAVHPLRAESVAWVSERKDVLAGSFWLLTLLAYRWYAGRPRGGRYLILLTLFALGLTAKAMLVTLPLVLLLADVWPLQRYRPRWWHVADGTPTMPTRPLGSLIVEKVPLLLLAGAMSTLTIGAQRFGLALQDITKLSVSWRIANALEAYLSYMRKTVWPNDLAVFYPHPGLLRHALTTADLGQALVAGGVLLAITVVTLVGSRHRPAFAFGWLWYLGTLVPVIGLVQVGDQSLADRYTYIPTIGLYVMVAWGLALLVARRPRVRPAVATASVAAVIALGIVAWFQIGTWRDSITLFTHAVAVTDANYFAHSSLGNLLRNEGRLDEAAAHFERALAIKPDFAFAHVGYGTLLERQGKLDEAAAQHERALQLDPASVRARVNLGVVRQRQGRFDEAVALLEEAVRREPSSAFARSNLGAALLGLHRPADAIPQLQQAVRLDPSVAEAYNNLGVALFRLRRFAQAVSAFERALQLKPGYANAQKGLEQARRQLGAS